MAPLPCETFDPERLANHISSLSNCTLTKRQRLYKSCHENAQILLITQRELQAHRDVRYMHRLASLQSTLLRRAHFFAETTGASLQTSLQSTLALLSTLLCTCASLQSTLLCRAHFLFFAEHTSLQSTLLCRAHFFAEHTCASLPSTLLLQSTLALLCRAHFFAEHTCASLQSTLLCRAHLRFFAEHTSLQSALALLCRAHFFAEHTCASLQSTLLCRAHFFAKHASYTWIYSQERRSPGWRRKDPSRGVPGEALTRKIRLGDFLLRAPSPQGFSARRGLRQPAEVVRQPAELVTTDVTSIRLRFWCKKRSKRFSVSDCKWDARASKFAGFRWKAASRLCSVFRFRAGKAANSSPPSMSPLVTALPPLSLGPKSAQKCPSSREDAVLGKFESIMEPGDSSMAHEWARLAHEWARLVHEWARLAHECFAGHSR